MNKLRLEHLNATIEHCSRFRVDYEIQRLDQWDYDTSSLKGLGLQFVNSCIQFHHEPSLWQDNILSEHGQCVYNLILAEYIE